MNFRNFLSENKNKEKAVGNVAKSLGWKEVDGGYEDKNGNRLIYVDPGKFAVSSKSGQTIIPPKPFMTFDDISKAIKDL